MESTPETRKLAQDILDYIEANPGRHDQMSWVAVDGEDGAVAERLQENNMCNTTMCIAGTALFLTRPFAEFVDYVEYKGYYWQDGAELLGLSQAEADVLFYDTNNETAKVLLRYVAAGDAEGFHTAVDEIVYKDNTDL